MKKFLFLAFSLAMLCLTAHANDDVGFSYTPTSDKTIVTDISMPTVPVVMVQFADVQIVPVTMCFVQGDFITSQMASQVFMCANVETRRYCKKLYPPNTGKNSRYRQVNHYRNHIYNFKH